MAEDNSTSRRHFVSLGMFIIDQFSFADEDGNPTGKTLAPQASPHTDSMYVRPPTRVMLYRSEAEEPMQLWGHVYGMGVQAIALKLCLLTEATYQAPAFQGRNDHR